MNSIAFHAAADQSNANNLPAAIELVAPQPAPKLNTSDAAIAIVDDDEWVLKSLARLVKSAGFKVETFLSAEGFLQSGKDSKTVCIILDIGLPGMSGLELQRHLAAQNWQVPIVFVSAHDEREIRAQALAAGAVAFLSKPVNDKALLAAVSSAVH